MKHVYFVICLLAVLSTGGAASAQSQPRRRFDVLLPESLFGTSRDLDLDGLQDDLETRLADLWRPAFQFDEGENDEAHGVEDASLRSIEPRVVLSVDPARDENNEIIPNVIKIRYKYLFRLDGGYRDSSYCNAIEPGHAGDTGAVLLTAQTEPDGPYHGVIWGITGWAEEGGASYPAKFDAPLPDWSNDGVNAADYDLDFEGPEAYLREHAVLSFSAGKHHSYWDDSLCEAREGIKVTDDGWIWAGTIATGWWKTGIVANLAEDGTEDHNPERCEEDCGGGAHRLADLQPLGYFTNIGSKRVCQDDAPPSHQCTTSIEQGCVDEPDLKTQCQVGDFINQPFTNELWALGYPHEMVWDSWYLEVPLYDCVYIGPIKKCSEAESKAARYKFLGGMNWGQNRTGEPYNFWDAADPLNPVN